MNFYGAAMALVLVPFANVVQLQWTNPPDRDLKAIRFQAWQVGSRDTITVSDYPGIQWETMSEPAIYPSSPDSIWFTVPCRGGSQWGFRCFAVDTAGNVSEPSNIVYKTLP